MLKLLIVDDDAHVREGLCVGLSDRFQVFEAADGEEALRCIRSESLDVILLDQNLGAQQGTQVLESISRMSHKAPVVVFSAGMSPALARSALGLGAEDCMTKPFQLEELRARLLRAVIGRSPRQRSQASFVQRVVGIATEAAQRHEGAIAGGRNSFTKRLIDETKADCAGDLYLTAERLGLDVIQLSDIERHFKNGEDYEHQEPFAG